MTDYIKENFNTIKYDFERDFPDCKVNDYTDKIWCHVWENNKKTGDILILKDDTGDVLEKLRFFNLYEKQKPYVEGYVCDVNGKFECFIFKSNDYSCPEHYLRYIENGHQHA